MNLFNIDCLEKMKSMGDYSVDLIFTDPPYALGSEVIIREDGKPDYKKAVDFMNKWNQPDGKFWEEWFKEAFRILKHGGRVVMFGMDRQVMLNKYYACFAGFQEQQSLYWYFASSFPKAADLSKMLDKHFGEDREISHYRNPFLDGGKRSTYTSATGEDYGTYAKIEMTNGEIPVTSPTSDLAKKYDGFKYSISPLKQTNETIMVFQKPYKTKSALHDTLAYENGDEECLCGALDIDGNRIKGKPRTTHTNGNKVGDRSGKTSYGFGEGFTYEGADERFPSQTFIDSEMADNLDEQSGERKSGAMKSSHNVGKTGKDGFMPHHGIYGKYKAQPFGKEVEASVGGCSKILQRCDYDEQDVQLYHYCAKVSKSERNLGVENLPQKQYSHDGRETENEPGYQRNRSIASNNHPTLKPIQLCLNLLKLFKTPNPQVVFDPFLGSGSIGMAAKLLGYEFIGCELDPEYFEIAKLRIQYVIDNKFKLNRTFDTKHEPKNKKPTVNDNDFF